MSKGLPVAGEIPAVIVFGAGRARARRPWPSLTGGRDGKV